MSAAKKPDTSLAVRANRWVLNVSRYWARWLLLLIGLYVGLPFVAPTLMHFGLDGPASVIYSMYSPLCHQMAFRSFFLYGQQPVYPRSLANVAGLQPYEAFSDDIHAATGYNTDLSTWSLDLEQLSRNFIGNPRMGYKIAICERDIAIYGALFVGLIIFSIPFVRQRLRPIPLWLYLWVGIAPIGIDGFSQLFSYPPFSFWPARESSPLFRILTGALFGLANAWLAFPYLEETARQAAAEIEQKFAARQQRQPSPDQPSE